MIAKPLPDKWVRKAISDNLATLTYKGEPVPVYDSRTDKDLPLRFVVMSTQNNITEATSKCAWRYTHFIDIECYSRIPAPSNPGSRLAADEIADLVLSNLQGMQLDAVSGLSICRSSFIIPADFVSPDRNFITYRKIIRLSLIIN